MSITQSEGTRNDNAQSRNTNRYKPDDAYGEYYGRASQLGRPFTTLMEISKSKAQSAKSSGEIRMS